MSSILDGGPMITAGVVMAKDPEHGVNTGIYRFMVKEKNLTGDLLPKLELAGRLSREARLEGRPRLAAPAGTTTQFVVGAQGETDRDLLGLVGRLEETGLLHHAHWSAFQPVAGTPMEGLPAVPAAREARLYQAEHLLRQYGFVVDELVFDARSREGYKSRERLEIELAGAVV